MFDIVKNGQRQNVVNSNSISNAKAIWNPFKIGGGNRGSAFDGASELEFLATVGYNSLNFNGCTKLKKLVFLENDDSTDDVFDYFNSYNIRNCPNLKSVSFPDTVTTIDIENNSYSPVHLNSIRANNIERIIHLDLLNHDNKIIDVSGIDFSTVRYIGNSETYTVIECNDSSYGGFDMSGFTNLERIYKSALYGLKISALPNYNPNNPDYNQGPDLRNIEIDHNAFAWTKIPAYNMIYFTDLQTRTMVEAHTFRGVDFKGAKIWLGNHITSIGYCAFNMVENFGGIDGGTNITTICSGAFKGCSFSSNANERTLDIATLFPNLTSFGGGYDPNTGDTINDSVFAGTNITSVIIPSSLSCGGALYSSSKAASFGSCKDLTSVTFSGGFSSIVPSMFDGCISLQQITLPSNLAAICSNAFLNSGLTSITIPNSVTFIGKCAFRGTNITSVTLPNNTYYVASSNTGGYVNSNNEIYDYPTNSFQAGCTVTGGIKLWWAEGSGVYYNGTYNHYFVEGTNLTKLFDVDEETGSWQIVDLS